ncbi:hypothetical protein ACIQTW_07765 [Paenarthrobacter sp. NPDC090517]|uniref:hypothetical protein n=1 Tax=Paenarthrobacter sp. NPDC090517 TaxID=3364381 RepID=UPI0038039034
MGTETMIEFDPTGNHPDPDLARRRAAWLAHIPLSCGVLFIGEAPPPEARYFYYPESIGHDYLFLQLLKVLYPELQTVSAAHMRAIKPTLLRRFADDGYLLVDAVEGRIPLNGSSHRIRAIRAAQEDLLDRLNIIGHNDFVAIPLKATVHDGLSAGTKSRIGERFINDRIPFPSNGQQENFRRRLSLALQSLNV